MTETAHSRPQDEDIRFVPLAVEHLPHFGDVLRDSVTADLSPYLIDNQPGYTEHLRRILAAPEAHPRQRLRALVTASGRLAAFADVRVHAPEPGDGFLSSLVVLPEFRGRGLATRMLREIAREFTELRTLDLDVFADNRPAIRLYDSLGFRRTATQRWFVRDIPAPLAGTTASALHSLPDPGDVRDELATVGFALLENAQTGTSGNLRLIGPRVIQAFDPTTFGDTDRLSAVAAAFGRPRTAILITDSVPGQDNTGVVCQVNVSHRMSLSDLRDLRRSSSP